MYTECLQKMREILKTRNLKKKIVTRNNRLPIIAVNNREFFRVQHNI